MSTPLHQRHLLTLLNHTPEEIRYLLDLARDLKAAKRRGEETQQLKGKNIALIFEKTSTRTRCAFEVAAYDQGANVTYLDPVSSQVGHKESIADTARVLGRFYDAIEFRGAAHTIVEDLAKYAGVPIFNGLTDEFHPTQSLADVLTIEEHINKPLSEVKIAYVGDSDNNVAISLMIIAAKLGMTIHFGAPKSLMPNDEIMQTCQAIAKETGATIECFTDAKTAVDGVDFIYTDVWLSMGESKDKWAERITELFPYQVNQALIDASHNPNVKFLHCLPAFHDDQTAEGKKLMKDFPELSQGVEVTHEVFEGAHSIVFDQAENRLHTIKAVMVASLA
ncbi:ornithine carbamoyltransferase [Wohlfahrtiimonas sp. G9077]|uniref:ornithine carbamoyltransferase n=1 Tax=Wohlfahrtiimonas sp. G9077 TaxID=1980118 RepID=UPI000B98946A|nr:ornithine carbamoyltransferase [Wohlfahrtiimonas sp. G9077]OYQ73098.1 ornithine carbamoyltransferase [Wohlfahrtiimonas sp. G9077]